MLNSAAEFYKAKCQGIVMVSGCEYVLW